MSRDSTVLPFRQPEAIDDPLSELAREGARRMLAQVLIAEADTLSPRGRIRNRRMARLYRAPWPWAGSGNPNRGGACRGPSRQGARPEGRGCRGENLLHLVDPAEVGAADEEPRCVVAGSLPAWGVDWRLPGSPRRPQGKDAPNLSPAVISRLTAKWQADYDTWQKRDLSARRYVYVWADGVYLQARMEEAAECMLVLIGATPEGKKELVGFQTGYVRSIELARAFSSTSSSVGSRLRRTLRSATARSASGRRSSRSFRGPDTSGVGFARRPTCWTRSPSVQVDMRFDLREICGAPTRAAAEVAIDVFADKYNAKHDKAFACLTEDWEALLALDFPAEHWDDLRTSSPIESVFEMVCHRTGRTKGALSAKTAKLMVFKLVNAAAKTWRQFKGENQLPKVVQGIKFQNGIEVIKMSAHHAA